MLRWTDSYSRFGVIALLLAGCVQTEEWTREKQTAVTTETISGVTPAAAIAAAEQVMRLSGGNQVSFDYRDDGFRASRRYSAYFVIGAVAGTYHFDFAAKPGSGGTQMQLRISQDATTFAAVGALPEANQLWDLEGAYELFFDRVEALTKGTTWTTCGDTKATYGLVSTHFEPMCLAARDASPQ